MLTTFCIFIIWMTTTELPMLHERNTTRLPTQRELTSNISHNYYNHSIGQPMQHGPTPQLPTQHWPTAKTFGTDQHNQHNREYSNQHRHNQSVCDSDSPIHVIDSPPRTLTPSGGCPVNAFALGCVGGGAMYGLGPLLAR